MTLNEALAAGWVIDDPSYTAPSTQPTTVSSIPEPSILKPKQRSVPVEPTTPPATNDAGVDVAGLFDAVETDTPAVVPIPKVEPETNRMAEPTPTPTPPETVTAEATPAPVVEKAPVTPEPTPTPEPTTTLDPYRDPSDDEILSAWDKLHLSLPNGRGKMSKSQKGKYDTKVFNLQAAAAKIQNPVYKKLALGLAIDKYAYAPMAARVNKLILADRREQKEQNPKATTKATKGKDPIFDRLYKEIDGIGDPDARMEALQVINDPSMEERHKIKAMASYLKSFPVSKNGVKEDRWMQQIDTLEAKSGRSEAEENRLGTLKKLMAKATAVSMSDLSKKQSDLKGFETTFRASLPQDQSDVSLAEVDTRLLTPKQRADASELGSWTLKAMGISAASADKEMRSIITQNKQANNAITYTLRQLAKGKEFNALNLKKREMLSNYIGLSDDDMERAFRDKQAQALINKYRHGLFGGALSKTEKPEFEKEAATLYQSNSNIALAITSMLETNIAKMEGIRSSMGPKAFNLKYGDVYRNLTEMNEANKKALGVVKPAKEDNTEYVVLGEETTPSAPVAPPTTTEKPPTAMFKKIMPDGRLAVKYSDGSIRYEKR